MKENALLAVNVSVLPAFVIQEEKGSVTTSEPVWSRTLRIDDPVFPTESWTRV
jgi:hypothetical protein